MIFFKKNCLLFRTFLQLLFVIFVFLINILFIFNNYNVLLFINLKLRKYWQKSVHQTNTIEIIDFLNIAYH
jgi:hypothetical protein